MSELKTSFRLRALILPDYSLTALRLHASYTMIRIDVKSGIYFWRYDFKGGCRSRGSCRFDQLL